MGFFEKLGEGLRKTRDSIFGSIAGLVNAGEITDELYDDLEEQLILADTGADVAMRLVEELRQEVRRKHLKTGADALEALKGIIREMLRADGEMQLSGRPAVVLVIGVNGVGKTTSIAKLAHLYKQQGKRVMLAAGDTFRAAAAEQLCAACRGGINAALRQLRRAAVRANGIRIRQRQRGIAVIDVVRLRTEGRRARRCSQQNDGKQRRYPSFQV